MEQTDKNKRMLQVLNQYNSACYQRIFYVHFLFWNYLLFASEKIRLPRK